MVDDILEAQKIKDQEAKNIAKIRKAQISHEKAEEEKRQKNVEHHRKINNGIVTALMTFNMAETTARMLVGAIAKGQIANVFIKY